MKKKKINRKHNDRNFILELLFAIQQAAHAEVHLVESLAANTGELDEKIFKELNRALSVVRDLRISLMEKLAKECPSVNGLWCTFKHLLLLEFHLFEIYEKTRDAQYLGHLESINLLIDDLLSEDRLSNLQSCPRCKKS